MLRKGFTLIELLVVVLIVGILSTVAVPNYLKTVDASKISDGFGLMMMIGTGQQMCWLDNPSNKVGACPGQQYLSNMTPVLVNGKYIANHKWGSASPYDRTPYFGTSASNSKSCVAAGQTVNGGDNTTSACMVFPYASPKPKNAFNTTIKYYVQNNVCKDSAVSNGAPSCP